MATVSHKSVSCHAQVKWMISKCALLEQEKFYQKETGFLLLVVIIYEHVYYIDMMVV